MKFINNRFWNIINFSFSLLTLLILNKLIGFNEVRSSYELTINLSRQILLFSGLNLISGNLIYFANSNNKSIESFRQLYLLNIIIVLILSTLISSIIFVFNLFSIEVVYAILLLNIILTFDFLGFFSVAIGNVYIQYFGQFILKIANISAILLIGFYNFDISILLFTYSISLIYILYISSKINLSPLRIQSLKPLLVILKKILLFSLPWFLASPILNFFSTYVWLALDKSDSSSLTYYSILLFGSSTLNLLLINPTVDKITYNIREKLSTTKYELYLFTLVFLLIGLSLLAKSNFLINNYYYNYFMTDLLFFDTLFISSYVYYIPIYVAFSCPVLVITRIIHINKRQLSYAAISVLVALLQLLLIYIYKDLNVFDFIKISLLTSFITYLLLYIYNYKIILKSQFLVFISMYILTFLLFS
tara:strand:- start:5412 stop:6668 length:1257 start_codon:yes stop_codon:yes gene_type:complete